MAIDVPVGLYAKGRGERMLLVFLSSSRYELWTTLSSPMSSNSEIEVSIVAKYDSDLCLYFSSKYFCSERDQSRPCQRQPGCHFSSD